MTKCIPTIAIVPETMLSLTEKIEKWVYQLCDRLQSDYDNNSSANRYDFRMELGRKYWKITAKNQGVHAFIDRNTGQVYKPASYKSPAKHVRYDLRIIKDREYLFDNADWAGSYLYLRG